MVKRLEGWKIGAPIPLYLIPLDWMVKRLKGWKIGRLEDWYPLYLIPYTVYLISIMGPFILKLKI
jgi:hypothetical protein